MTFAPLLALALLCPQGTPAASDDAEALERFAYLRSTQKAMLVARVRGRLLQENDPAFARIHALKFDIDELPEEAEAPIFDPERSAPGRESPRTEIRPGDPKHDKVAKRFARTPFFDDLHAAVRYDWCRGEIVQLEVRPGYDETFENLLRGYPPGTDQALARVLATLDRDERVRKLANWFGHTYADLESKAYVGVTLYDAWYSGEAVNVPDVDALPFAWDILGRKKMKYPLGGKPRNQLYEAIKQDALRYRKYRTTREAAAAAFVRDEPRMDEIYARLVPRFHFLFATHDDSLDRIVEVLSRRDRDSMIDDVDRRITDTESDAWETKETRRKELRALREKTRKYALEELDRFAPR